MHTTNNTDHLTRSLVWSSQVKEVLEHELMGWKYVNMITDFPDGDTLNIPSIGQAEAYDYIENQPIQYSALDTGNFQFSVTDYKASAHYITNKAKQDFHYMSQLVSSFVPGQARAIMTELERDILALGPDNQTSADTNTINGAYHRYVGGGTEEVIELADFQRARYALQKAAVPLTNLVAIVDPSVEMTLSTLANLTTLDSNPRWEGIVRDGMSETGMQFRFNIYGWDVYTSEYLKKNTGTEAISGVTAPVGSVNNLFFSAAPGVSPFVGNMRQAPMVDSEYNKDLQRDEYVTTARWGLGLLRPENLVTVVTALDQVYA